MSESQTGWSTATIEEVCTTKPQYGWTTKSSANGSGLRYLRITDITEGTVAWSSVPFCVDEPDSDRFRLADGDIVVARSGATFGRSLLVRNPERSVFASYLIRLRVDPKLVDSSYLAWFMKSSKYWDQAIALSSGIAQPNLNAKSIGNINVPLAPLQEQQRIVAAIEEQLSRVDAAVASLQTVPGRLEVLLARMIEELLAGSTADTVALADVLDQFVDCPHRTPRYSDDGAFPALRPRDVVRGVLNLEGAARVNSEEYEIQTERHAPTAGDIVYSRELSYGWAAVLPDGQKACLSQGMVAMTPSDEMDSGFLASYLNSAGGRRQVVKMAGGTAHPHVNLRDIRAFRVPKPPVSLQQELMAEVERRTTAVSMLRVEVERALRRSRALRAAVLSRAFGGRLVPMSPVANQDETSE